MYFTVLILRGVSFPLPPFNVNGLLYHHCISFSVAMLLLDLTRKWRGWTLRYVARMPRFKQFTNVFMWSCLLGGKTLDVWKLLWRHQMNKPCESENNPSVRFSPKKRRKGLWTGVAAKLGREFQNPSLSRSLPSFLPILLGIQWNLRKDTPPYEGQAECTVIYTL